MRALAFFTALVSCGWAPSNLEDIKAQVWKDTIAAPGDYGPVSVEFVSTARAREVCFGNAACYDPERALVTVPAYLPNCGPLLAMELTHAALHVATGLPDEHHLIKEVWARDFSQYRCEE